MVIRLSALLPLAALIGAAPPRPLRIASINPCIDAVLWQVAAPSRIAAISAYSQDPRATSVPLAWADRFPATSGTAEELVALRPDVVLSGAGTHPATAGALRRLGIRLVEYPVPETIAQSEAQVRDIARIAGDPTRGERLVAAIDAATRLVPGARVPALIWREGGLVLGTGTLADALLTRAGFRNKSAGYGLAKWGMLPLEYLIAQPPRVLLSSAAATPGGDRVATHPAIRRLGGRMRIVPFAGRLTNCGGPTIVAAMARLKAIRAGMPA